MVETSPSRAKRAGEKRSRHRQHSDVKPKKHRLPEEHVHAHHYFDGNFNPSQSHAQWGPVSPVMFPYVPNTVGQQTHIASFRPSSANKSAKPKRIKQNFGIGFQPLITIQDCP